MAGQLRIGVTNGLRGFFAVLYDDEGPIQSGPGSFKTAKRAAFEAQDWATSERIPLDHGACKLLGKGIYGRPENSDSNNPPA